MSRILLNWLPPSMVNMPSPAHSVLKNVLEQKGHQVTIEYWNLRLNSIINNFCNLGNEAYSDLNMLLPFFAYLSIEFNQELLIRSLTNYIYYIKPQLHVNGNDFVRKSFVDFWQELNSEIDTFIEIELNKNQYKLIGFSSMFYQWIPATIIAKRIKEKFPEISLLIGGFGSKREALAFKDNFNMFDYISWGEGENSLELLCKYLEDGGSEISVPNTIDSQNNRILSDKPIVYHNIDDLSFNFVDYINKIKSSSNEIEIILPIEGGRGCHWRKCHFCYLNTGYKNRFKQSSVIIKEISAYIETYGIYKYMFLDNDIIGGDLYRFNAILDGLISLRDKYNDLTIVSAEIITYGITYEAIVKMSLANFESVQIGYESPSSNLLIKIQKKNTFASNLFFIKWAVAFGIKISGANIIRNLLEEEDADICEAIDNLRYLRFLLNNTYFNHAITDLAICEYSKYFKKLQKNEQLSDWSESPIYSYLPKGYIRDEDKYALILDFYKPTYSSKWNIFSKIEKHYINNAYTYSFIKINEYIYFRERYNGLILNEIEFKQSSYEWLILTNCNKRINSLQELCEELDLNSEQLVEYIENLKNEGLIYCNRDYSEIVSILDTDRINTEN